MARWDDLPTIDQNTAALQWWTSGSVLCVCDWNSPLVIGNHLRLRCGEDCLGHIVSMFVEWIADGGRPVLAGIDVVWRRG